MREAQATTAPEILPHATAERPTWSVMIPVHNCADFLEVALTSVVTDLRARDDVEIVVVDDMSTDAPEVVVARCGAGMVDYVRLDRPYGAVGNFNECIKRSRGELVHVLHGDDAVKPGFYAAMERPLRDGSAIAAVCRTEYIDAEGTPCRVTRSEVPNGGVWHEVLDALAMSNRVRPSGIVIARSAYERVGGYRFDLPHAADWEMWARVAVAGPIWFVDEVLARYRVHESQDTATRVRTGLNITERREAIEVVGTYLPAERRGRVRRRALRYSAVFSARTALYCVKRRDMAAAWAQLREGGACAATALRWW